MGIQGFGVGWLLLAGLGLVTLLVIGAARRAARLAAAARLGSVARRASRWASLVACSAVVAGGLTTVLEVAPANASAATSSSAKGTVCAPAACATKDVHSASVATPGYWTLAADGGMFSFGTPFYGSTGGVKLVQPMVGMAPTADGKGYWLVARDGGVFSFGDAHFHGSTGGVKLAQPIVGIASDPATGGYWMVAADGGIFGFDAPFYGSTGGVKLTQPVVGMAPTADGKGYWLVARDGGVFAFGDARFHGSTGGVKLAQPIVGMASDPATGGYWMVAADGGMFSFDAPFYGSTGGVKLAKPVVGMSPTPDAKGYWLVASDGGIFSFGDAQFHGSTGGVKLVQPVVGMAGMPGGATLTVTVTDLPAGTPGSVTVTRPDGSTVSMPNGGTISPAAPGQWTVSASPVGTSGSTYFPSTNTDVVTVQPGAAAKVTVDYANAAYNTDRVVTASAISSVSAPDQSGQQTVILSDPTHQLAAGDTLVSGTGPATPMGLLLHVVSVTANPDGTETVVGTPASLTDIGPEANLSGQEAYDDTAGASPASVVRSSAGGWLVKGTHQFSDALKCDAGVYGSVDAAVDFSPTVNFQLQWGGYLDPGSFTAAVSATGTLHAGLKASISDKATCSYNQDILPKPINLGEMDFQVGPVPVVVIPQLNFNLTADADVQGTLETGVNETLGVTAGVKWDGSTLSPISGVTNTFDYEPLSPSFDGGIKASIGPRLTFALYGIGGPYIRGAADGQLKVSLLNSPWWQLLAGLEAGAGIHFSMFGQTFDKGDDSVISKNWVVAQSSTPSPGEPLEISTTSLPAGTQYQPYSAQLQATGGTSPYTWKITGLPQGLSADSSGAINGNPTQSGSFAVTAAVLDSNGKSTSVPLTLDVTAGTIGEPGSISGTVKDGTTAAPLSGVKVVAFGPKGFTPATTTTAADGTYELTGLPAGTYDVCFDASGIGGATLTYSDQCYDGSPWNGSTAYSDGAKTVTLGSGLGAQGIDADLGEAGFIAGTVTDSNGAPLQGVVVEIDSLSGGAYLATGTTGPDGKFDIGQIPPGYQTVCFNGDYATGGTSTTGYGRQCFDAVPWDGIQNEAEAGATRVLVTAGQTTDLSAVAGGSGVTLPAAGSFSGTVTDTDGQPLGNVTVYTVYYDQRGIQRRADIVHTAADGTYTDQGLQAGYYQVCFDPTGATGGDSPTGYVSRCFPQPVRILVGANSPNIDAVIVPGGAITGHVTDTSANPLEGAAVSIDGLTGYTDASGAYTITGIPAGSYTVCFDGHTLDKTGTYTYGSSCTSTKVTVTAKVMTAGVDGQIPPGGGVSGTVTDQAGHPLSGVTVYDNEFGAEDVQTVTGTDGTYHLDGLSAGTHDIGFNGLSATGPTSTVGYLTYDLPSVTVPAGSEQPNVDAQLAPAGSVTGTVTDGSGKPLQGVRVSSTSGLDGLVSTSADGTYTISGMTPGSDQICFDGTYASGGTSTTGYLPQCITSSVAGGTPTTGVNAQLSSAAGIRGTITDSRGTAVQGVDVIVYDAQGNASGGSLTLSDGTYNVIGLPAGSYYVCYDAGGVAPSNDAPYGLISQCNAGVTWYPPQLPNRLSPPPLADLTSVGATAGSATTVDAQLTSAGQITGKVTDTGGNPLVDVAVDAVQSDATSPLPAAHTGSDGTYTITGLAPGTFSLCLTASGATSGSSQAGYLDDCGQGSPSETVTAATSTTADVTLQSAAGITGTVTDDASNLLSGAQISVYDSSGNVVGGGQTSSKGVFTAERLAPGTYYVCASAGGDYTAECYESVPWDGSTMPTGLTAIATTAGNLTAINTMVLPRKGTIAGTVTDTSGHPLSNVSVQVLTGTGNGVASATTDSTGSYSIPGLDNGSYDVCFAAGAAVGPAGTGYGSQCYSGVAWSGVTPYPTGRTAVSVAAGATTTVDVSLDQSGSITGTVTDTGGNPLSDVAVEVIPTKGTRYSGTTASDGTYTVADVPPGSYSVCFDASGAAGGSSSTGYADQCFNGVAWDGGALPGGQEGVTVVSGKIASSVNGTLAAGATVAGTVTDGSGDPLAAVGITIYAGGTAVANTVSAADGTYSVSDLNAGNVNVCFSGTGVSGGTSQYGYTSQCSSSAVTLTAGQTTTANASLAANGQVTGTVTDTSSNPLQSAEVSVLDATGHTVLYSTKTAADGSYAVDAPAGSYEVCFTGSNATGGASTTGYGDVCYQDAGWDGLLPVTASATAVTVTSGSATAPVDASLPYDGAMTGTVTDQSAQPLSGVAVEVFDSSQQLVDNVPTASDGTYVIANLAPGSYSVCFNGEHASGQGGIGYGDQCYDGVAWTGGNVPPAGATPVSVTVGQTATNIDGSLPIAGGITGTVSDNLSAGVAGAAVDVYTTGGSLVTSTTTGSDGSYTFNEMSPGSYLVCVDGEPVGTSGDSSQCYNGVAWSPGTAVPAAASPVTVASTGLTTANFVLTVEGGVSGEVTDTSGDPLSQVQVEAIDSSGHITYGSTLGDGTYAVKALPPGDYHVCFAGYGASYQSFADGFGRQCYNGYSWDGTTSGAASATPVPVAAGSVTPNIGGTLPPDGGISGSVTDLSGNPLSGATVVIQASGSNDSYDVTTASNGSFLATALPPGTYTVCYLGQSATGTSSTAGYGDQCYQNVTWTGTYPLPSTDTVTVTANATMPGIDGMLAPAGGISGTVTDSNGAAVQGATAEVIDSNGVVVGSSPTGSDGYYQVNGLTPTSYRVCIAAQYLFSSTQTAAYQDECYANAAWDGSTNYPAGATSVTVNEGAVTTGISVALPPGGAVAGTVTDTSGNGLQGVTVGIFDGSDSEIVTATTDSSGQYVTGNLPPGTYGVCFYGGSATGGISQAGYADSCTGGEVSGSGGFYPSGSVTAVVTSGSTTTGIDGKLSPTSRIAGTVTDSGGSPVANVYVEVLSAASGVTYFSSSAYSGPDGTYSIEVPVGTYNVCFQTFGSSGSSPTGYASQCYKSLAWDGTWGGMPAATTVTTTSGQISSGIDATLADGGEVSGTVKDTSGDPLQGVYVSATDTAGGTVTGISTASDGSYSLPSLSPGTYQICFSDSTHNASGGTSTTGYSAQCYNGTAWDGGTLPTSGTTPITLSSGTSTKGVDAQLGTGGAISGQVTDTSGVGLAYAEVEVFDSTTQVAYGYTDQNGDYIVDSLTPGTYSVCFDGAFTGLSQSYGVQCYSGVAWDGTVPPPGANPVTVTAGGTTTGINGQLASNGSVSGTVTDSAGHDLGGVTVVAVNSGYGSSSTTTNPDGTYTLPNLTPGSYYICFSPTASTTGGTSSTGYAPQCYNAQAWDGNSYDASGTSLSVQAGSVFGNIDATLTTGGAVSGTVKDTSGDPLGDVTVSAFQSGSPVQATTATDGSYEITGLALSTTTFVCFDGINGTGGTSSAGYLDQCYKGYSWDGSFTFYMQATDVTVQAGSVTSGIDATLVPASEISGKVTDSSGDALAQVTVSAFSSSASEYATTGPDGTYTIPSLPAGSYEVCFDPTVATGGTSSTGYAKQCYNGVSWDGGPVPANYNAVVTQAGAVAGNTNATVAAGGAITGTVTDTNATGLAGVSVTVTDSGGNPVTGTTTDQNGAYTISGLTPGSYQVCFDGTWASGPLPYGYQSACYTAGGSTESPVSLSSGQTASGVGQSLAPLGGVSGTVTDSSGDGLAGVDVYIYDSSGNYVNGVSTLADGTYTAGRLTPGSSYTVCFYPGYNTTGGTSSTGYLGQCWKNVALTGNGLPSGTTAITASSGSAVTGIDAALTDGGAISGTVTDASSQALQGASVEVFDSGGNIVGSGGTDANGNYTVDALAAGTYDVCFNGPYGNGTGYASQCYKGQAWDGSPTLPAGATGVSVTAGQTATSIDAQLSAGGAMTGTVQDTSGAPITNARAELYNSAGQMIGSATTDSTGTYTIEGVTPGSYTACFDLAYATTTGQGTGYASQCYNSVAWQGGSLPSGLSPVTVTAGASTTVDATAQAGGAISGRVTDSSGTAFPYSFVLVYDTSGAFVNSTEAAASGAYTVDNLTPGDYYVCFQSPTPDTNPSQCYNGVAWNGKTPLPSGLTAVTVTTSATTPNISAKL